MLLLLLLLEVLKLLRRHDYKNGNDSKPTMVGRCLHSCLSLVSFPRDRGLASIS